MLVQVTVQLLEVFIFPLQRPAELAVREPDCIQSARTYLKDREKFKHTAYMLSCILTQARQGLKVCFNIVGYRVYLFRSVTAGHIGHQPIKLLHVRDANLDVCKP